MSSGWQEGVFGGASGTHGFDSDTQAQQLAVTLWDLFGGGSSSTRPFGSAVVDGFDFYIENGNPTGYAALIDELRSQYFTGASKQFYISTAPQCVFPDASIGDALANSVVDYAFIQFYKNYCEIGGSGSFI